MAVFDGNTDIPAHAMDSEKYRTHPLLHGRAYYSLPVRLLNEVVRECDPTAFDEAPLHMDFQLAPEVSRNERIVGYRDGAAFSDLLLTNSDLKLPTPSDRQFAARNMTRER
jgi:hypothetical protein